MTNATTPSVQPGWYLDPAGSQRNRWWDGFNWTDHFQDSYSAPSAADLKAPEGTDVRTKWIWLLALAPLTNPLVFAIVYGLLLTSSSAGMALVFGLQSAGAGIFWLIYGLCAWVAYLDWKQLQARGVPRPFHFAWVFLSWLVYVIGRAVVARRRTGSGISMMWVGITMPFVSVALSIVILIVGSAVFRSTL